MQSHKFPYLQILPERHLTEPMPYLPLTLERKGNIKEVFGLLDSGSTVNVLPYKVGLELGAVWDEQRISLKLTGNLANYEARALFTNAQIPNFPPVELAFTWTNSEYATLILGQTNFLSEFNVCFYRSQNEFEIRAR